ncbi:MAG: rRNA maturation RNase YbeY [Chloroflexi bacterium]|nr:rRNA maturation RNase YbeY [Chloroflexota bacterium]
MRHLPRSRALLSDRRLRQTARGALRAGQHHRTAAISLAFVGDRAMRRLNRQYAANDYTTDVLSFPAHDGVRPAHESKTAMATLGDIAISLPQALRQARRAGHSLAHEVDTLLAHGILHLLGYDHATAGEAAAMSALQERALRRQSP